MSYCVDGGGQRRENVMESVEALIYWLFEAVLLFALLLVVLFAAWGMFWFCRGLYWAYRSPRLKSGNLRLDPHSMNEIERALVGWFETSGFQVQHDGHQWFAWVDDKPLPLTDIAVTIFQEQAAASTGRRPAHSKNPSRQPR